METEQGWRVTYDADGKACVFVYGNWTRPCEIGECILEKPDGISAVSIDGSDLSGWNTGFAAFLFRLVNECTAIGVKPDFVKIPDSALRLLELSTAAGTKSFAERYEPGFLEKAGDMTIGAYQATMVGLDFIGVLLVSLFRLVCGKAKMRWIDVWSEIIKAGPNALFIVSLIGFLIGLILAFIGAIPLQWFSAEIYVASLIGIGVMRLMGAVMTGVVMAGRTGAAFSAELGTMQVNEEIDALRSMGIPIVEFLVLPRLVALSLMLPLLCLYSNIIGILGGMVVSVFYLKISALEYWIQLVDTTRISDLVIGLFTSFVYAVLISICGCLRGIRCGRSSASVGQATTAAMVSSIICMVIATAVITVVTVRMGF